MSGSTVSDATMRTIALKEFAEFTRRPWILVLAILLGVLSVGVSYAASAQFMGRADIASFEMTIRPLRSVVGFLVPIMAIILAYSALAGEQESGSLGLLLAQPVTRAEVVLGKYVGLFGVLAAAIVLGFGVGGLVIAARAGTEGWDRYVRFVLATLLYTGAYFALFFAASALSTRRNQALLAGLGIAFFFGILYFPLRLILLVRSGAFGAGGETPTWFVLSEFLSVPDLYTRLIEAATRAPGAAASASGLTALLEGPWAAAIYATALLAWGISGVAVALNAVQRKDV